MSKERRCANKILEVSGMGSLQTSAHGVPGNITRSINTYKHHYFGGLLHRFSGF
jgi:hypothetical protein